MSAPQVPHSHRHLQERAGDVAALICTEPSGRLPFQSVLLAETIRLRGGRFADMPIYSFQPRRGPALPERTRRRFFELGVIHLDGPFNTCLPNYGHANKAYICAWAEAMLPHERLVLFDSDTLVLSEPDLFDLPSGHDVAVAVEPFKVGGTDGDDENTEMWDTYQRLVGTESPPMVTTRIDQQRIRGYYNGGLIIARREAGIMREWLQVLEEMTDSGLIPGDNRAIFTDQISFTLALVRLGIKPLLLPPAYNYPLAWQDRIPDDTRLEELDQVAVAHYFRVLDTPTVKDPLTLIAGLEITERDAEISELIRRSRVTPDPRRNPLRTARFKSRERLAPIAKKLGMRRDRFAALSQR